MKLFFNYSIDCESPPDGQFGGPATWEDAEASTRGFIEVMEQSGARRGASLFVYPDVALRQRRLYREMAEVGVEIAPHLHGMRYSRLQEPGWLGAMSYAQQREALRMARCDLEEVTGQACFGYRACYASTNHDTYPILEELGFTWSSTSASGSYKPAIHARWAGGWPFPYHPSRKNKLVPGDLKLYEVPVTRGIRTLLPGDCDRPLDIRAETPPSIAGTQHEMFDAIIEENLREMERRDQPVRAIIAASHNTNPYADRSSFQHHNVLHVIGAARCFAQAAGLEYVPAGFDEIRVEAERVDAF